MALFLNELKPLRVYNGPYYYPIDMKDRLNNSIVYLLTPDIKSTISFLNSKNNKPNSNSFNSYFVEKNIQFVINKNLSENSNLNINGENIKVSKPVAQEMNTIKTPSGKFFTLLLSDGTTVKLNAQSTFRFPSKFSSKNREVYLKGEAYFDVYHDPSHPFIVKTDYFEAKAVGTSFDVRSYDAHQASVTLV